LTHQRKFIKASLIVGLAIILSRILGLIREQYSLILFGAGWELDAYISAYKLPTFLRNLLGEGAFSIVFTSIFSNLFYKDTKKAEVFTSRILSYLFVISLGISFLALLFTPQYMSLIHHSSANFALAVHLSRIMVFFINFISIAAIFMGILNSWERYFIPAFAPAIGNIFNILIVSLLHKHFGITALAIGYLVNSFVLMVIQIPYIFGKRFHFRFDFKMDLRVRKFFKSFFPVAFGVAFFQINQLLSNAFSSRIEGGNSVMDRAFLIIQMAIAILSTGISVVLLPLISRGTQTKEKHRLFHDSMQGIFLVVFPTMILFLLFSYDIASFIFRDILNFLGIGLGKIEEGTIKNIGKCIFLFAPGIVIYSLITISTRTLQGLKKYSYPVIGSAISTAINFIIMELLFDKYRIFLLPVSINIASIIDLGILLFFLGKQFKLQERYGFFLFFIKNISAGIILFSILKLVIPHVQFISNIGRLPLLCIGGIIFYFVLLLIFKEKNVSKIFFKIKEKIKPH
jgi:putative peptidoglycan lipid II flippase